MLNINIFKIMIFIIAIVLSSCSSFEQRRQFAYKILDNPDSLVSIYWHSEFCDSLKYSNNLIHYLDKGHISIITRYFRNKQYRIYDEREDISSYNKNDSSYKVTLYYLTFKSTLSKYYLDFVFEKVDNKWVLVSMPIDIIPYPM